MEIAKLVRNQVAKLFDFQLQAIHLAVTKIYSTRNSLAILLETAKQFDEQLDKLSD